MKRFVFWLCAIAAVVVFALVLAGRLDDAVGTVLFALFGALGGAAKAVPAAAGAVVNEGAKALGAREVKQKPGAKVPRNEGLMTNERRSVEGEKPTPKTPYNDSW